MSTSRAVLGRSSLVYTCKVTVEFRSIYLIGVLLLGFFYYPIKQYINDPYVLVPLAIVYLLAVRFIGHKYGKRKEDEESL